jgi:hypothetical protein
VTLRVFIALLIVAVMILSVRGAGDSAAGDSSLRWETGIEELDAVLQRALSDKTHETLADFLGDSADSARDVRDSLHERIAEVAK